jgi:HNH endonuclease/NUMOD4 motif
MKTEQWRSVVRYEGVYEVSDFGSIRRLRPSSGKPSGTILAIHKGRKYPSVELWAAGSRKVHYVHRIVAMAFIPNPEAKREVNHKNFNRNDNSVSNLEWVTDLENRCHYLMFSVTRDPTLCLT